MKRVLLDTECWLWWHLCPDRLNRSALEAIEERRSPLFLSAASSWEIAIKVAIGKLELPGPAETFVPRQLAEDGILGLAIEHAHALRVARLPHHHNDPFDRLLIAQSQVERCQLMTADAQLAAYEVDLFWAGQGIPPGTVAPPRPRARRPGRGSTSG